MTSAHTAFRILVVVDEIGARNLIGLALNHQGYSADFAQDATEAIAKLHQVGIPYSVILVDVAAQEDPTPVIEEARRLNGVVFVVGLTDGVLDGLGPKRTSVDEIIEKPITGERLRVAVQKCLRQLQNCSTVSKETLKGDTGARSSVWQNEIESLVRHVASADIPVLIQGETGVGKEVLARQLHAHSPRSKKPFLKVNCAALPSELIESELFGYERGAFTGAFKSTSGKFEMADGGSILLDEIGDMDFKLQAKLLQVLQDREFIRLGSSETRRVDVRVLAATHMNLEQAITEGRFREDLYYRLNIITMHVPALRDRKEEILPLAHYFMHKYATTMSPIVEITPCLRDALLSHDWPGNIRELENVMRRLLVLRKPDLVRDDLCKRARRRTVIEAPQRVQVQPEPVAISAPVPAKEPVISLPNPMPEVVTAEAVGTGQLYMTAVQAIPTPYRAAANFREDLGPSMPLNDGGGSHRPTRVEEVDRRWSILNRVDEARREAETKAILHTLNSTLWNRKRAAELLSIDYKALLYKMKKLGIVDRAAKIAI
jgi:two-component system response regulator AtoC